MLSAHAALEKDLAEARAERDTLKAEVKEVRGVSLDRAKHHRKDMEGLGKIVKDLCASHDSIERDLAEAEAALLAYADAHERWLDNEYSGNTNLANVKRTPTYPQHAAALERARQRAAEGKA